MLRPLCQTIRCFRHEGSSRLAGRRRARQRRSSSSLCSGAPRVVRRSLPKPRRRVPLHPPGKGARSCRLVKHRRYKKGSGLSTGPFARVVAELVPTTEIIPAWCLQTRCRRDEPGDDAASDLKRPKIGSGAHSARPSTCRSTARRTRRAIAAAPDWAYIALGNDLEILRWCRGGP